MRYNSVWYENTIDTIDKRCQFINKKNQSKYKINTLKQIIINVDDFSCDCSMCDKFKKNILGIISCLDDMENNSKHSKHFYLSELNRMSNHLSYFHRISIVGGSMTTRLSAAMCLGTSFGITVALITGGSHWEVDIFLGMLLSLFAMMFYDKFS
ncbi:MAG: hypothetical protein Q8936_17670 [Bacillota bacterium]|nr:hypothetical protein [Bacillota bacterium]